MRPVESLIAGLVLAYQQPPTAGCVAWLISWLYSQTLVRAAANLYFRAPWPAWAGLAPADVCAAITPPISATHWQAHADACVELLHLKFEAVEIVLRYSLLALLLWAILRAFYWRWVVLPRQQADFAHLMDTLAMSAQRAIPPPIPWTYRRRQPRAPDPNPKCIQ